MAGKNTDKSTSTSTTSTTNKGSAAADAAIDAAAKAAAKKIEAEKAKKAKEKLKVTMSNLNKKKDRLDLDLKNIIGISNYPVWFAATYTSQTMNYNEVFKDDGGLGGAKWTRNATPGANLAYYGWLTETNNNWTSWSGLDSSAYVAFPDWTGYSGTFQDLVNKIAAMPRFSPLGVNSPAFKKLTNVQAGTHTYNMVKCYERAKTIYTNKVNERQKVHDEIASTKAMMVMADAGKDPFDPKNGLVKSTTKDDPAKNKHKNGTTDDKPKIETIDKGPVVPLSAPTSTFSWNLPPHIWSTSVEPVEVYSDIVDAGNDLNGKAKYAKSEDRRGILFPVYSAEENMVTTTKTVKGKKVTTTKPDAKKTSDWGFQFMWNPAELSKMVSMLMEITPDPTDFFATNAFAYPTSSSMTLNLVLDRTNDFACLRSLDSLEGVEGYYKGGKNPNDPQPIKKKVQDLFTSGTAADLEYLYRAINGSKLGQKNFNKSADLGWIRPSLMQLWVGPFRTLCIVQTIDVKHVYFTQNMIPLRTEVTLQLNLKSNAGLTAETISNMNKVPGQA